MPEIPKVELLTIRRQTAASGIPVVAAALRDGRLPPLQTFSPTAGGVMFVECPAREAIDRIRDVVAKIGDDDGSTILSPLKAGESGTLAVNALFHQLAGLGRPLEDRQRFIVEEPVIFLRNDYRRDLRNGSLGTVVKVDDHGVVVSFDGAEQRLAGRDLDDLDHAYAITVHKAQDSGFPTGIVPVVASRLLDRALVYTAVTRAIERVVLVGSRDALRDSVEKLPISAGRQVGLVAAVRQRLERPNLATMDVGR